MSDPSTEAEHDDMVRKGYLWVETAKGERIQVVDRFRMEYQNGAEIFVVSTEPSLDVKPVYLNELRRDVDNTPLSEQQRAAIGARVVQLLTFSGDPFRLIE